MNPAPSRAERRASSRTRTRRAVAIIAGVSVAAVVAVVVALVAGGGENAMRGRAGVPVPETNVTLEVGTVSAESAGAPAEVSAEQANAILQVVGRYLKLATVDPLRSAAAAGDLSGIFDAGALARATGVDRAVLLDEGLPKVTGDLEVVARPVDLVGLGDQNGSIVLVTASIDVDVTGATAAKGGRVHIVRRGDVVLAPDESGTWRITGFSLVVARDGSALDATTTEAPR